MNERSELDILKDRYKTLESQYSLFQEAKRQAGLKGCKKKVYTYATMLKDTLTQPTLYSIIGDDSAYQFEDFSRYVESDMDIYMKKINARINELENS